jgi:hypothetical protein
LRKRWSSYRRRVGDDGEYRPRQCSGIRLRSR